MITVRIRFVSSFTTVTLTPGITAPEESFTTPRIVPVFCCAVPVTANISRRVAAAVISLASTPERFPVLPSIPTPFCSKPSVEVGSALSRTLISWAMRDAETNGIARPNFL